MAFDVTMRQLLEAGVHFGHQTKRWDPRMKPYIYTSRNDIHVIDLQRSIKELEGAYHYIKGVVSNGGRVLFVGTKKQAQDAIEEEAKRCGMPFVARRWLGGALTNLTTIRKSVRKFKKIKDQKENGTFDKLPMKEVAKLNRELGKLDTNLGGVVEMSKLPAVLFIVDTVKENIAVMEARRLGIPVVAIVDTNSNPQIIDVPIPGNDDAIRAIKLISSVISQACLDGSKELLGHDISAEEKGEERDINEEAVAAIEKEEAILETEVVKDKEIKA